MLMVGTIQRLASLGKVRRGFTGRCLNIRRPVSEILFETFEGVDSSNISFIKKHDVSYSYHSFASHSGFYFPPAANKDRAVNSMEIKDLIILWTYSQWRQAIVVIPPLSPERETFRMLPLISFCILALYKNRTFRFTPVICKDCTALHRGLADSKQSLRLLSFLSREENVLHASVNYLLHS